MCTDKNELLLNLVSNTSSWVTGCGGGNRHLRTIRHVHASGRRRKEAVRPRCECRPYQDGGPTGPPNHLEAQLRPN